MHIVSSLERVGEDVGDVILEIYVSAREIYNKYGSHGDSLGIIISTIDNQVVHFTT
jgi:hypothetical protein